MARGFTQTPGIVFNDPYSGSCLHSQLSWHVGKAGYALQSDGDQVGIAERTNPRRHIRGAARGVPKGQSDGLQA